MPHLPDLASHHLEEARRSEHGRSAELLVHDGPLRQSMLALLAGTELGEHNSPPAASLQVLTGRVRVTGEDEPEVGAGELHLLTHQRHAVTALEDSVFVLTTVTGLAETDQPPGAR